MHAKLNENICSEQKQLEYTVFFQVSKLMRKICLGLGYLFYIVNSLLCMALKYSVNFGCDTSFHPFVPNNEIMK